MKSAATLSFLIAVFLTATLRAAPLEPAQREFFENRIRPVLVEHCYECHNTNDTSEAGLALDFRNGLLEGGENGSVISKSDPNNSLLLKVLRHEIDGVKMPENGPKLDATVIADFEKWIGMGAPDPRDTPPSKADLAKATSWESIRERRKQWWSFQPITSPTVPSMQAAHPVDRFVARKLKDNGLKPADRADRRTLIRRAHFVLTGLPPTPEEVDAFVANESPDAFPKLVDKLLESPAYGERWARHWMDWVRYTESHGSEGDPGIQNAWHYRDYLIRALNADLPYDQMLTEHIAGDLLPDPRIVDGVNQSLLATGHWRMVFHGFAPTDALDEKVRFTDDQIDTFSKAFLGLTVSCARCHNHKFDAISQADYYALFGILGSSRPGRESMQSMEVQRKNFDELAELKPQIREKLAADWLSQLEDLQPQLLDPKTSEAADKPESLLNVWHLLEKDKPENKDAFRKWWAEKKSSYESETDTSKVQFVRRWNVSESGSIPWYANGIGVDGGQDGDKGEGIATPSPAGEFRIKPEGDTVVDSILPAGIHSGTLSTKHPARLASSDFNLGENEQLWLRVDGGGSAMTRYVVQNYPRNGTVYPVSTIGDPGRWRWNQYDITYWSGDALHVELTAARDAPLLARNDERSWFSIREAFTTRRGTPGPPDNRREFLSAIFADDSQPASREDLANHYSTTLGAAIEAWRDSRLNDEQAVLLDRAVRDGLLKNTIADLPTAKPLIEEYRRLEMEVPATTRVPTLAEWSAKDSPLFVRGNHKTPGDRVPRRFLEAIDEEPYETNDGGRMQLAEDMLRDDNPFTRRVIVNRVWHYLFGAGLVETPDNFGRMGSQPTHPELLDYLATRFENEDQWQLKSLIRFLITSDTWQQSSLASGAAVSKDPSNHWLSHANVRRMDAEIIRDTMLATDGRISSDLYGSPVDGNSDRRSVYIRVIRNRLNPFLNAFDAPVPFRAAGRRETTNVPAQSLLMMNDPFVIQSAEAFAARAAEGGKSTEERVVSMWRHAFGRDPTQSEKTVSQDLVASLRKQYGGRDGRQKELNEQITQRETSLTKLIAPVRERLLAAKTKDREVSEPADLKPIAAWDFESNGDDSVGKLDCTLKGDAKIEDGALVLNGKAWATTPKLGRKLREKSFEALVQLNNLNQVGGGVITVQTRNAVTFDAIVFGERQPGHWMSGSDGFRRTNDFNGPAEKDAANKPVHIVITYDGDGNITGYRNGQPYGKPYQTSVQEFSGNKPHVLFGMRHGTGNGDGRMLNGRVFQARLYDRALTAEEVAAASNGGPFVTDKEVLAKLTEAQRENVATWREDVVRLNKERKSLENMPGEEHAWVDLAHSIYNLKEFIYVP